MTFRTLSLAIMLLIPNVTHAKEIQYNHKSITILEVKDNVNFTVLSPDKIPDDWTLEIKTYPSDEEKHFTHFRLHYMDKDDTILNVGIEQRKETPKIDNFSSPNAEKIDINDNKGLFSSWVNSEKVDKNGEIITGGRLQWRQNGTFIEMVSTRITKEQMLEIARSMKVYN
ncbi:DUF4367 domain-containing protein [Metabacillus litoralis]|uniref:DUF4367 domain-containing protein n=1 Tax=Metabacillus litoralis TaxID=152268 RepID=UPI00203B3DFA|nr:DUF4367 domain-containing protein [Metabacillus litoralis]MCM3412681.1 DUF4367 domain-containing protein [Metabacillus litoralis]